MKKSKELWARMGAWVEENGLIEDGGAKLKEFCAFFSINRDTYFEWMKNPDFSDIITRARETFRQNLEVEIVRSLAKAAVGYSYKEKHEKIIYEDNGKGQPMLKGKQNWNKEVSVAPNVQAATFLLSNINPEKWKRPDKHEVKMDAPKGLTIICGDKEEEELHRQLIDKARKEKQ